MLFLVLIGLFLLGSCGSTSEESSETEKGIEKKSGMKDEEKFESRMAEVDNNKDLAVANSLSYSNNEGSTAEVAAFLDKSDNILKLEESFTDAKTQSYGKRYFYIENGKKYATREVFYDTGRKKAVFVERITYYNQGEKPIYTKQREAEYEIDMESLPFQMTSPKDCSIDRAMRILNQEGEFETTFQGFASDGSMNFLLVGENSENGYASSLAVQHTEGDIRKLMNNEKAMVGTPLEVQYERMIDERDFQFQVLVGVKIK